MQLSPEDKQVINDMRAENAASRYPVKRKMVMHELTAEEQDRLVEREAAIESAREAAESACWTLGRALAAMRDDQMLWVVKYKTWTRYCSERWGITRRWANMVVKQFRVSELLGDPLTKAGMRIPEKPTQIPLRAISLLGQSNLNTDSQAAAYQRAVEKCDGEITTDALKVELKAESDRLAKPAPEASGTPVEAAPSDATGSGGITTLAEPFVALRQALDAWSRELTALAKTESGLWLRMGIGLDSGIRSDVAESIRRLRGALKFAAPFAACPTCGIENPNTKCPTCGGLGWVREGVLV